jgi:hypothetical protein
VFKKLKWYNGVKRKSLCVRIVEIQELGIKNEGLIGLIEAAPMQDGWYVDTKNIFIVIMSHS